VGTALLTTYISRSAQVHQAALAANVIPGSVPYRLYIGQITEMMMARGMSAAQASQMAVGRAYQDMLRQAVMLSYKNAFFILSVIIICLVPLPFIMRLPNKRAKLDPEAMGH
jgi:DHA2 family multidrug resistance protein